MVPLVLLLGFVSGGVALSYEVLWGRELLNVLGSTTRASAVVLTAFMGGITLGALLAGEWSRHVTRPLWLFAAAEAGLALIGFGFSGVIATVATLFPATGASGAVLVALLLVPALLMGIALPSLAAAQQGYGASQPRHVAWLYGLNTLGGAIAALAVGLGALPAFGLLASERGVAAAGLLAALVATGVGRWRPLRHGPAEPSSDPVQTDAGRRARLAMMAALFLGGVAALGYQVLWTRILVLVVGSSSNAFTLMLGLYLAGLAIGGFLAARIGKRRTPPPLLYQALQLGVAGTALSGLAIFGLLPAAALTGFAWLGTSPASIAAINIAIAAVVILPPTICIGAAFPVAARLMQRSRVRRGREVGLALALTTAGNVAGILLTALVVIPLAGLQRGVAILVLFNLGAAFLLWISCPRPARARQRYLVPLAVLGGLAAMPFLPAWDVAVMTSGVFRQAPVYLALLGSPARLERAFSAYRTRYYREGPEAVVGVFDRPTLVGAPHRVLTIDGKVDASTGADMATQILSGHLPLLFKPDARNALVIGLASGVTVGALARYPLEKIAVVEIEPAVIEASRAFDAASGAPLDDPRVAVTIADGRRYLRISRQRYDVIVSEPSNPWLSMSARLFTREFFRLARDHLAPGGVMVQWLPLYGLSGMQFRALLRTMLDVFPELSLFQVAEGDLVAIAGNGPLTINAAALTRLFAADRSAMLKRAGVDAPADLLARWSADAAGLRAVVGPGPLNTDDNGLLEFGSPWYVLSDTRRANLSVVERAWENSGIAREITTMDVSGHGRTGVLEALANRYLARDRADMLRALASALRASGAEVEADLLAGDAANAEGRWQEAEALWAPHDATAFRLRRARLAYRLGDHAKTARLFASVPGRDLTAEDRLLHALARVATDHPQEALDILAADDPGADTVAGIVGPFVMATLLERAGQEAEAAPQRRLFAQRLDALRRCLEADGCGKVAQALFRWGNNAPAGIDEAAWDAFRQSLFVHVSRPLPRYFEGVRSLWLGERDRAIRSFRTYLALLPGPDPLSKAHEFIARSGAPVGQ